MKVENNFEQWTDGELAAEAQMRLRGQGAIIEGMRRLRESAAQTENAASRLSIRILNYTIAMFIVVILQLGVAAFQAYSSFLRH